MGDVLGEAAGGGGGGSHGMVYLGGRRTVVKHGEPNPGTRPFSSISMAMWLEERDDLKRRVVEDLPESRGMRLIVLAEVV